MMSRSALSTLLGIVLLFLVGCGTTPVARDLNQHQANEIVALLNMNGIEAVAEKESGGRGAYFVTVESSLYARAVTLMTQHSLPSETKLSFADLLTPQGILPNSREMESLRLDRALGIQIEEMLTTHPAVLGCRVVVRSQAVKPGEQGGVSIVVQRRPGSVLDVEQVRAIVGRVLPGIGTDNISVTIEDAVVDRRAAGGAGAHGGDGVTRIPLVPFLFEWRVAEEDHREVVLGLIAMLLGVGAAGIVAGYWYGNSRRVKGGEGSSLPQVVSQQYKSGERSRREALDS